MSLGCALIANVALLANMAGHARFDIVQPTIIVGFGVAAFLLIGLLAAASRQEFIGPPGDHALTQAFYYGIWAAGKLMEWTIVECSCFDMTG